ncbi:hypothetical protein BV133_1173 [Blastochloris viridis]|uniref:Uncharacterized protein n=1 Tax=Blastochloris viridis TaxID=1079 RepID=A0A182CZU6_BLAVI|nr:hypothetical protein BV133_1173 [Blastochloris viridis]
MIPDRNRGRRPPCWLARGGSPDPPRAGGPRRTTCRKDRFPSPLSTDSWREAAMTQRSRRSTSPATGCSAMAR